MWTKVIFISFRPSKASGQYDVYEVHSQKLRLLQKLTKNLLLDDSRKKKTVIILAHKIHRFVFVIAMEAGKLMQI